MNETELKLLRFIAAGHPERTAIVRVDGVLRQVATTKWDEIQVAMNMSISQLQDPIAHLVAEGYIDVTKEKTPALKAFFTGQTGDSLFYATEEGRVLALGPTPTSKPLEEGDRDLETAVAVCDQLGYTPTQYGVGVLLLSLTSGYSPVESASQIALATMATDIKDAGTDILRLMGFMPHTRAIIDILHEYTDRGLMRQSLSENDMRAYMGIAVVRAGQQEWIARVLSDEVLSNERLATSKVDYSRYVDKQSS